MGKVDESVIRSSGAAGVIPGEGKIYAPIGGTVTTVAATGHAVSLRKNGEEILVHAGIDTVRLNGEGFNPMIIVVRLASAHV